MKDAFIYILLSGLDGFSFFFITLGLFRISFRDYFKEISVAIILISIGTYYLSEVPAISNFIPIINIILIILFLILMFKVSFRDSMIVVLMGYPLCMGIQWLILKTAMMIGLTMQEIKDVDTLRRTFQLLSSTTIISISCVLRRYNLWFTFVPHETNKSFKMSFKSMLILLLSALLLIFFGYSLNFSHTVVGLLMWIITFFGLFFVAIKKEFN